MRALKQIREVPSALNGALESLLGQFSATTLEINPSLGTAEFARQLAVRAMEMFGARATVLVLERGPDWGVAAVAGPADPGERPVQRRLAAALAKGASESGTEFRPLACAKLLGAELSEALGWSEVMLARLEATDGALLGVLCLVDVSHPLSAVECQLLEALAGHASVALENLRLISKIEQSRKQWVEDFDAISDFILVHDAENRILRLNRALAELLGVRPTQAIGRSISEWNLLNASAPPGQCPFCRLPAEAGLSAKVEREEFIHQADGRAYLVSTSRLRAAEGERRTIHVLKDITDRREAEHRYRRERDFNENILNNTQSMILVLDTAGLISYANRRCHEAGYKDLLGHALREMVPPARQRQFAAALERALEGGAVENLEVPLLRPNADARQFSISLSPMRGERGEINSVVAVMTDITAAADLQAKLMQTEKMAALGQLVSGVAHEVNNPLAAIVGFADLLIENPAVPAEAKQEVRIILQEAERTRLIVQNLLSFARQTPARRELVEINSVLRQTLKLRSYDFANHGIDVAERYAEDLPQVMGDPHQLQQVFLNILNNAYDAIQEARRPGKIEVATSRRNGRIEIAFRDNGPGISHPDRVFDPFFTTKEIGKGTGLGLSICYGIVRSHRGEILASNNSAGKGCTFLVRLPVAAVPAEELAMEAES